MHKSVLLLIIKLYQSVVPNQHQIHNPLFFFCSATYLDLWSFMPDIVPEIDINHFYFYDIEGFKDNLNQYYVI